MGRTGAVPHSVPLGSTPRNGELKQVRGLGLATAWLLGVLAGLFTLQIPLRAWGYHLYQGLLDPDSDIYPSDVTPFEIAEFVSLCLIAAVFLATAVVFLVWLFRVRANAERLGTVKQRRAKGWLIAGWIVPVVNFWFPKQIVTDIWRASQPDNRVSAGGEGARGSFRGTGLLWAWWLLWWAHLLADRVSKIQEMAYTGPGRGVGSLDPLDVTRLYRDWTVSGMLLSPISVAAAVLALLVVLRITKWQQQHHAPHDGRIGAVAFAGY